MSLVVKSKPVTVTTGSATTVWTKPQLNDPVNTVLKKTYNVIIKRGESHPDWFVVRCEELHVNTQGKTYEEAVSNAIEAINLVVDELGLEKTFNLNIQRRFSD